MSPNDFIKFLGEGVHILEHALIFSVLTPIVVAWAPSSLESDAGGHWVSVLLLAIGIWIFVRFPRPLLCWFLRALLRRRLTTV